MMHSSWCLFQDEVYHLGYSVTQLFEGGGTYVLFGVDLDNPNFVGRMIIIIVIIILGG